MKNAELEAVKRELEEVGIKPEVEYLKRHIRISWLVNGKSRAVTVAKSGSDLRGALNARSYVRRLLRDDGLYTTASQELVRKRKQLQKAMSVPEQPEPLAARVLRLEQELACLIDVVLEKVSSDLPSTIEEIEPPKRKKGKIRAAVQAALEYNAPKSIQDLMGVTKLEYRQIAACLCNMKKDGLVEHRGFNQWVKPRLTLVQSMSSKA